MMTFAKCPPGFFLFNGALCLKSEYGQDEAYVGSGECFWGGTNNRADRAELMVEPIGEDVIMAALEIARKPSGAPPVIAKGESSIKQELWCVHLTHSDEAMAAPTWVDACRVVDDHNLALGYLDAEVVRWPHSAEGHAQDVAQGWKKFADDTAERRRLAVTFRIGRQKASQ